MRITDIKTYISWGNPRNSVFVKIMTDEGIHGWGEATVENKELTVQAAIVELVHNQAAFLGEERCS